MEEYRSHNSADVNECIAAVKKAITTNSACGEGHAEFNSAKNICEFDQKWYEIKCEQIGGYYESGVCYL
ncbi:MAG: hypothetical protein LBF28_02290 [Rickettsiales bacterium]|nr:hypothetical protein [Rickettsiales bacterium]